MSEVIAPNTLDDLHTEFKKVAEALANNSRAVDHLSSEVARTSRQHETLSAEHNALTNRVNHIDLRISVMEETTRLQNKHNEEVHKDFKDGLRQVETSLEQLGNKLEDGVEKMSNGIGVVHREVNDHIKKGEEWQRKLFITAIVATSGGLFGVLAYIGRWIFIEVTGG